MVESTDTYGDWRSLELAIKDAAKKAAAQAGPGISAASVSAQIKQANIPNYLRLPIVSKRVRIAL